MRKVYLPLSFVCLLLFFTLLPIARAGNISIKASDYDHIKKEKSSSLEYTSNLIYERCQLNKLGLSKQALMYAYKGLQYLVRKGLVDNPDILTICDFSQSSFRKRLYIIDVANFKVLMNTFVAHGRNSGLVYANRFSNNPSSLKSSLGFYVTKNTYFGEHGLSLRLAGLEKGYNDKAESRAIVVHGADYIGADRLDAAYMGRSFGCPAVPENLSSRIINLIKDGTCLFIYHPTKSYLHGSRILNG